MITIDIRGMQDPTKALNVDKVRKAGMRAINRAIVSGRKAGGQEVAADYNISGGKISKLGDIKKSSEATLRAKIHWKSGPRELKEWGTTPSKRLKKPMTKQLRVKVRRGAPSEHSGVFIGKGRTYVRKTKKRMPIRVAYGPAPASLPHADKVQKRFVERTEEMLKKRLMHELGRIL